MNLTPENYVMGQNWNTDLLRLFQTGDMFDCCFKVGHGENYKEFKCHTLILSKASLFFRKLFASNFKEAEMDRAEPITLDKIEPEVFECAMRNVYGKVKDFRDVSFAVKVFKFAHEMQIEYLAKDLTDFIGDEVKADEVFAIYDFFRQMDSIAGLNACSKIITWETAEALASESWLSIKLETVQEFLRLDCLDVEEADLLRALIKWGKFQVQKDGEDPDDMKKLRIKILPAFKLIRFAGMDHKDFAKLSLDELKDLLSSDEKLQIMQCFMLGDFKLMPKNIAPNIALPRRNKAT